MKHLTERNAEIARHLRAEFPASDKLKRLAAAKATLRTPVSFNRKLSGSPVEVRPTTLAEAMTLAEEGYISPSFFSRILAPAGIKAVRVSSQTPLAQVLTVLTRATAVSAEAFADLKITDGEKNALRPIIDKAECALNALRTACATEGVTRL